MRIDSTFRARTASTLAALLVVGGAAVTVAPQASAGGDGNKVHNCFGRWYNTDWDQKCGGLGADYSGTYETKANCSFETDNYLTVWRKMGSTATYDGHDCDWSVTGALTYFYE